MKKTAEINPQKRLERKLSELEEEWSAIKTGKSSGISWLTMEGAIGLVENSPRKLMISLQHQQDCPEAEEVPIKSPYRRKLFQDSGDEETTSFSALPQSSCCSSKVVRVRGERKKRNGRFVASAILVALLVLGLVLLMKGFDHFSIDTRINTLVPT